MQMSIKQGKSPVVRSGRVGEGYFTEVLVLPPSKGGLTQQLGLDFYSLPVPDRRLSCDTVSLVHTDYMIKLLFAQREVVGDGYLSMLVVQMSFEAIHNFLPSIAQLEPGLELITGKFPSAKLTKIEGKPQQCAVVTASYIFAGFSGTDACLDFYYISPFSVQSINILNKVSVEPVVRVNVPTYLLLAMLRELQKIAPSLPSLLNGKVTS